MFFFLFFKTIFFKKKLFFFTFTTTHFVNQWLNSFAKKQKTKSKTKNWCCEGRESKKKRFSNQWDFQTREIVSLWSSQGWFKRGRQPLFWVFLFFLWHTTTKKGILNTKRIDLILRGIARRGERKQHISLHTHMRKTLKKERED